MATAVVSDPPRPSVVTSLVDVETPWKPATSTMWSSSRARPDALGAHVEDARLGVRGVGDDPGLRAGERDRAVAEVVDGHRTQRTGDALAGGEQHVHLARIRRRGDFRGHGDQLIGGLAARAEHRDHRMPGLVAWRRCDGRRA